VESILNVEFTLRFRALQALQPLLGFPRYDILYYGDGGLNVEEDP
jgi:hypothetical protein